MSALGNFIMVTLTNSMNTAYLEPDFVCQYGLVGVVPISEQNNSARDRMSVGDNFSNLCTAVTSAARLISPPTSLKRSKSPTSVFQAGGRFIESLLSMCFSPERILSAISLRIKATCVAMIDYNGYNEMVQPEFSGKPVILTDSRAKRRATCLRH